MKASPGLISCLALFLLLYIQPSKANFKSVSGFRLKNHTFKAVKTGELKLCIRACGDDQRCKSINYRLRGQDPDNCELNDADETEDGGNYGKDDGYIYHKIGKRKSESPPTPPPEVAYKSCAELKAARPSTPSGNYVMHVRGFKRTVYCDMDTAGGGWSLVVAISSSNQEHRKTRTVNCFNSSLCVAKESGLLTARKLSDLDIRALAFYEGTFKIDMLTDSYGLVFTHYYRLAEGAQVFSSGCEGNTGCPRIIVSYAYPYVWESNCKGIEMGYHIANSCHRVFDGHDNAECGETWFGTGYRAGQRILYGTCGHNGVNNAFQAQVYVK
ncbi:uncharacterized protein LOC5509472 [Nematostella vectensis]|uniref:uncharacterized protein LOC5509472 n=1 Tax=Nematostella vectensis TaxID=45351 RepID=UPI002076D7DB|nr:uncharacterized protein LOC5509472 [Nematostella vectensis]